MILRVDMKKKKAKDSVTNFWEAFNWEDTNIDEVTNLEEITNL